MIVYCFLVILLGDGGVGKSSLVIRFTKNRFDQNCMSTVGIDFAVKSMVIDSKKIKGSMNTVFNVVLNNCEQNNSTNMGYCRTRTVCHYHTCLL